MYTSPDKGTGLGTGGQVYVPLRDLHSGTDNLSPCPETCPLSQKKYTVCLLISGCFLIRKVYYINQVNNSGPKAAQDNGVSVKYYGDFTYLGLLEDLNTK